MPPHLSSLLVCTDCCVVLHYYRAPHFQRINSWLSYVGLTNSYKNLFPQMHLFVSCSLFFAMSELIEHIAAFPWFYCWGIITFFQSDYSMQEKALDWQYFRHVITKVYKTCLIL